MEIGFLSLMPMANTFLSPQAASVLVSLRWFLSTERALSVLALSLNRCVVLPLLAVSSAIIASV